MNIRENRNQLLWSLLLALVILPVVGCNGIKAEEVTNDFKKTNPDAVLLEQFVGEGDSEHAYVHFRYTKGKSIEKYEEVWVYQRQQNNAWKIIKKEGPKSAGSKFGD